jgi:hypothetical protein
MHPATFLLWLGAFLVCGCGRNAPDTRPWPEDPMNAPRTEPAFFDAPEARRLKDDEFGVVTTNEREAVARLEQAPWIELSQKEAEELLGHPLAGTGGRFVLLRATGITERMKGFEITWRDKIVKVYHGDHVFGQPKPTVRRALVARLPDVPTAVTWSLGVIE